MFDINKKLMTGSPSLFVNSCIHRTSI